MEEIGEFVASEIQCVVIPTILGGKSLLLSSPSQQDIGPWPTYSGS
jgi:hypothetical protein